MSDFVDERVRGSWGSPMRSRYSDQLDISIEASSAEGKEGGGLCTTSHVASTVMAPPTCHLNSKLESGMDLVVYGPL